MWRLFPCLFACVIGIIVCPEVANCSKTGADLTSLLELPFNRFLRASVPKPFQIVFPKLIRQKNEEPVSTREHIIGHHGIYEHYEQVAFQVVIDKKKHKLKLERNDGLFSAGIKVKHFEDEQREIITKTVEHCYYQGVVKRDEWSAVAVSTCDGIRGIIQLNNETWIIQPLTGVPDGEDHPHMIYKATKSDFERCGNEQGKWLPFHELHKGEFLKKQRFREAQRTMSPQSIEEKKDKFLKLALILDNSMYWSLNLTIKDMLQYAIETANIVDLYYQEMNVRMALTYVELWNHDNRIPVTEKLRETMENFMKYQSKHLRDVDHHAAHLLTRTDFEDDSVGMAIPDAICTGRAGGINKNPRYLEIQKGATILAHMIGHNLGIKHDEQSGCLCEDEYGCIMSTDVLAAPETHSRRFSTCSSSDLDLSLSLGIAACLTENPQPTFPQACGNKHVERGEECDCGSPEDCAITDPCCDPHTCLLRYWADCRTGACCHNCTYLSADYMCRGQSSDCDVPEFCTGNDGQCPNNNYARDGHPCNNSTGYCMGGICPTLDHQCQHIWGHAASMAEPPCYERFNPTGNFNGHCGLDDRTGSYAKCMPDDIQCGLLHCSGGNKQPFYGPDKDSSTTTFSSNGKEYECKTVHGPSTMELPNLGLVLDGTKCGEGRICMQKKCLPLSNLPPLLCPHSQNGLICSGHGICTKDDTCFCEDAWIGGDCSVPRNGTRVILSIDDLRITTTTATTTTTDSIRLFPVQMSETPNHPTSTEMASAAVVQVKDSGLLTTKWMMIILAGVIGGLALLLGFSFLCYRRRSPMKLGKQQKKKKYVNHCEEGEVESSNKLIKFGNLPSYKNEKKKMKKKNKKGKKGSRSTEDDSDIGELPPPPVIITDPNSAKPEKGILKGTFSNNKYMNERRSSESNTATSDGNCDQDSVGPYDEIDEDTEAGEIQDIFGGNFDEPERTLDVLDNMIESSSFDFMLPPPFSNMGLLNRSPSPPRKFTGYDIPMTNLTHAQRPNLWKSNMSPPKSRVLRMKNLDEIFSNIDRNTIDLSPSPDDPPVQISPSTSEDVRSSSTDDRQYQTSSQDPQSPNSFTSGSTCTALRPLLGSQWSKYVLHRNNQDPGSGQYDFDDMESPLPHINIPPPMNPINIRSIFNYGQKVCRDNNDTPLGSQNGDCSSNNGTANSGNSRSYDKSSGYGSEHDPERFSIDDLSRTQSRSGSTSPPNFSAVIRTGPNQIKLVPAGKLHSDLSGYGYNPMDHDLHKLLEGVPRIDAGCYERSPITSCSNVTSGTSTLETMKNSMQDSSFSGLNSDTNTLVNSDYETMERYQSEKDGATIEDDRRSNETDAKVISESNHPATNTLEILKQSLPEYSNCAFPNPKPLSELDSEMKGSGQCIDRSLEEISVLDKKENKNNKQKNRNSLPSTPLRPASLVFLPKSGSGETGEADPLMGNRFSAIEPVSVDIGEC